MVYPRIVVPAVTASEVEDRVKAGAAGTGGAGGALTVIEYVAVADELELVPVIVYMTADAAAVGVPEITPVAVLKLSPFPIDGEIE